MTRIREQYGNASLLHFCSMADPYNLHHVPAIHRLLCLFGGYTAPWGTISNEGQNFSAGVTFGTSYGVDIPSREFEKRKLILMWGWNPLVTHQGTDVSLTLCRAKELGTRFIAVDPRFTNSAGVLADQWILIRPGTDVAALLAMAYVIISDGLCDSEFIDINTVGYEKFSNYVLGKEDGVKKTPEWAEKITGVKSSALVDVAHEFACSKPAIIHEGRAPGRSAFGEQFHRAVSALNAITGNSYIPPRSSGGGPSLRALRNAVQMSSPPNPVEAGKAPRWNALPYRGSSVNSSARVNVNLFADAILRGKEGGYPANYKFLWLSNTNYLNQLGDINKARKAFDQLEFMLVTEQFLSATAMFADIVLPVCTYLERNDIFASGDGGAYGLVNKAIEPLGESRSQLQICQALALELGITDYDTRTDDEILRSIVGKLSADTDLPDYETLKKTGITRIKLRTHDSSSSPTTPKSEATAFPTPSGKIEIYSQRVADMNHPLIPPIPKYIEPWEGPTDSLKEKYPFQLISPHLTWRAHSQFDNLPWLHDLQPHAVTVNSIDAQAKGIREGEMVRVFNDRGEVRIPAHVTERLIPGVVEIPQGARYKPDKDGIDYGGCPNTLTSNRTSPAGAFTSDTVLVQIEKIGE
jgi:anaerobic dimethyl sulfoxide reductase subunit A